MNIRTIGLDLVKNVFQFHGVDAQGKVVLRKQVARASLAALFANLPPCLVGMEACGSAHFWPRKLAAQGHVVKLMAPQFVEPCVKGSKTDAADAEAICEAVSRPNMRFVPVKLPVQQALLAVHRARAGFVKARTTQANQLRGLLAEFGIAIPVGLASLRQRLPILLAEAENGLPGMMRELVARLAEHLQALDQQVAELEKQIQLWHRQSEPSQRLAAIPGVGPITATALVASIGDARAFSNGRQLAAWLGLVPRQHSSGGKPVLLGISKRGDVYLRTLLIHGTRAVISHVERRCDQAESWLKRLLSRRNRNISAVALANKNARVVWALLAHDRQYGVAPLAA
ncbi:MAG TPA: IS110 family transposase [Noviherbaspirillum sp.]|nr:IS110 family transposase [Noviherbaspirillum sp.]